MVEMHEWLLGGLDKPGRGRGELKDSSLCEIGPVDLVEPALLALYSCPRLGAIEVDLDQLAPAARSPDGFVQDAQGVEVTIVLEDATNRLRRRAGDRAGTQHNGPVVGHAVEGL